MATVSLTFSNAEHLAHRKVSQLGISKLKFSFLPVVTYKNRDVRSIHTHGPGVRCAASGSASGVGPEEDPFTVLGVNPLSGFDAAQAAHRRRKKDAEKRGDKEELERLEVAYNKIMMRQFELRRKGLGRGSFEVSKDIRYADRRPLLPWMPRKTAANRNDIFINAGLSSVFVLMNIVKGYSQYRFLQFLGFAYFFRLFFKLKGLAGDTPRYDSEEEDGSSKRDQHNGKILLRSAGLVCSTVLFTSMAFYVTVKGVVALGAYPAFLASGQELITTLSSAILLFIIGTWYR